MTFSFGQGLFNLPASGRDQSAFSFEKPKPIP
jgi:hypothetical protein